MRLYLVPERDFTVFKHLRRAVHPTIMYWKLLLVTLAIALSVSATPIVDWPTGGAPPPVADDTSSGSDPRPSHPGVKRSDAVVYDSPGGTNPRPT
ncbi:hypothetical protein IW262DRAFT_544754 [Armillaria fumosa]|nr:hypothetical protein IW262DRAFT_544754 [Armillaria fumosa]